ncbi:uncharacterized protein LOC112591994, partial [Melanaphis sacchari]|uniref:uncharacterized protein LOC112591994 n=1 Tax=Melanaphis sacchari TaxID=742174 RepID=UPI000DC154EA
MPNCDWGRACCCSACRSVHREGNKCSRCAVECVDLIEIVDLQVDRKSASSYEMRFLCPVCNDNHKLEEEVMKSNRKQRRDDIKQLYRLLYDHLKQLQENRPVNDRVVRVCELYKKMNISAPANFQKSFVRRLPIKYEKINNRYYCSES